jgi:uncharacterized protein YkwD
MTFLQLNLPQAPTSQITVLSMTAATLLLLSFVLCQSASAQSMQPQPVARLITGTVSNASYSRPRRVITEERSSASAVTGTAGGAISLSLPNATSIERRAFEQTNRARGESGLGPLTWDSELCRMARLHSQKMAQQSFFSHESPDGMQLKERARANGILHFRVIAENIAYNKGYADPGAFAVERWMISAGHRANILYTGFQASAIGSYVSADGSVYLTQVFIAR